ncbi:MAG: hypothetical protein LAT68_05590 [Cyclobacteriaceae bacterium]|nr:hypothetical protein [Cyclobacteriaceae bacterium]MCH8515784.1 hypothetical protein [Cyclobacteriaceae bacterium]
MKTVIYIEITDQLTFNFNKTLLKKIKNLHPSVVTFDFDNLSEPSIVDYAISLVDQCNHVAIILQNSISKKSGNVMRFLDYLCDQDDKNKMLIFLGENEHLSPISKLAVGDQLFENISEKEQEDALNRFLKNGHFYQAG